MHQLIDNIPVWGQTEPNVIEQIKEGYDQAD